MNYLDCKLNSITTTELKTPKTKFPSPRMTHKTDKLSIHQISHLDISKNLIRTRAFKHYSSNLSFKGSFFGLFTSYSKGIKGFSDLIGKADKVMANVPSQMIEKIKKIRPKDIIIENDVIKFREKGLLRKIFDAAVYPVTQMPIDLLDFSVRGLRRIPALKNSKSLENFYNNGFLAKNREKIFLSEQVGALQNILTNGSKLDFSKPENEKAFMQQVHSLFDPRKGNYNTVHERALNRIVSGMIPAYFLANDSYNLSRYCDDNKDAADKEKKVRFKQEVARVGTTAYLQLVILSALAKVINSSIWGAVLSSTGITIFTELFSRKFAGKPVWLLDKEGAKKQFDKEYKDFAKKQKEEGKDLTYVKMPVAFKKERAFASFAQNENNPQVVQQKKKAKPPVTLSGLVKYSVASTLFGFGLLGLRKNVKAVDNIFNSAFKPFKDKYNKIAFSELKVSKENLKYLAQRFENAGYSDIAKGYQELIDSTSGNEIVFGKQTTNKKIAADFLIGPFKFVYKALALPYNLTKKVLSIPIKSLRAPAKQTSSNQVLGDGVNYLLDNTKKMNDTEFKNFVDNKILSSFNKTGRSNYSNADLAVMTKLFCSTATSFFLVADHYNLVMTKSRGEDQKGAMLKAKERVAQRVSATFYSTLFIDLFNNSFRKLYHASLLGMSAVTAACTYISEIFTRVSIGMPVLEHSKAEIEAYENMNNSRKGILGDYFRFMSRLTGKKILSERVQKN